MKRLLILFFLLNGCAVLAKENSKPPGGEEIFDILFDNVRLSLKDEPHCNVTSMTRSNMEITLGQHLATIMSVSYESANHVTIKTSCLPSKDDSSGNVLNVWDCKLEMNETSENGSFISSAMVAFYISFDKTKFIKGSIRCL